MVFESIPGAVLQMHAVISNKDREWVQVVSLLASAFAVGAISSRMSYYMDISVRNREKCGNF
jgi:hypothetical protein